MLTVGFGDFPLAVVGLIMAGGKGSRMGLKLEKPLIKIGGKTMLERVAEALKGAKGIERIVVATSPDTPRTGEVAEKLGLDVIETPGQNYVTDAQRAIRMLIPKTVLVISADLPLVSSNLIDEIIECYLECGKPSLRVVTPTQPDMPDDSERPNTKRGSASTRPVGINIIDSRHIDESYIDEAEFVISSPESVLNVNSPRDLERILPKRKLT